MTYLEVMVALAVIVVALSSVSSLLVTSYTLSETNRESALATEAARKVLEEMQAADFATVFALYNETPNDDPAGTAPGASFDVAGLDPVPGDADGFVGEVVLPSDPVFGAVLREDIGLPGFGGSRDLNSDGTVDALDHAADYTLLPVLVRVEWRGASGQRVTELRTHLVNR